MLRIDMLRRILWRNIWGKLWVAGGIRIILLLISLYVVNVFKLYLLSSVNHLNISSNQGLHLLKRKMMSLKLKDIRLVCQLLLLLEDLKE